MAKIVLPSIQEVINVLPILSSSKMVQQVHEAHLFAADIHGQNSRPSGELYIEHDRAVAHTLGQVGIDISTITAGLLHDTLMLTYAESDKTERRMADQFGPDVTNLVVGLNKIAPYTSLDGSEDDRKLEKLRRAILHIVDNDIRILLIRMADSLNDLLVAKALPRESQVEIAREAAEIYAPIANRLGVWSMKWQLEDLSFRYLHPNVYKELASKLSQKRHQRDERIAKRVQELRQKLESAKIEAEVKGRSKHIYSLHRKMVRKNLPFEEIYDLHALRIIVAENDLSACYQILGMVHNMWVPIPEEFDDYIANPKPNGYSSLHTAVYDQDGQIFEVQIRTRAMDDEAERGIAAHWAYKEDSGRPSGELTRRVTWLRQLLIDLRDEEPADAPTEQRMINVDDLSKRIYVFTPNRDLIELPEGGTPIDFAYQIHTEVGHKCRGAKVNGKMVPLNYQLKQGDTISIIKAKHSKPSRDWMSEAAGYTQSGRTRSKVRQWFRINDREENILRGMDMVEQELKRLKLSNWITAKELAESFRETEEDFYAKVGFGDIQYSQLSGSIGLIQDKKKQEIARDQEDEIEELNYRAPEYQQKKGLTIQGLEGLHHRMANCCSPIPPEPIIGYITRGRGVSIHRKGCDQFMAMVYEEPGRLIEVDWGFGQGQQIHQIPMIVQAYRRSELAEDIATLVSGRPIQLSRTKSATNKKGLTTVYMTVHVHTLDDIEWLTQKLNGMSAVLDVRRQRKGSA